MDREESVRDVERRRLVLTSSSSGYNCYTNRLGGDD